MSSSDTVESISETGKVDPEVTVTHKWILNESCLINKEPSEKLVSPVIAFTDSIHCRFWLYPNGDSEDARDYVSVYLTSVKRDFEASFRFYILNNAGQIIGPRSSQKLVQFNADNHCWGFTKFRESKLLASAMKNVYSNGRFTRTFTIVCDLTIDKSKESETSCTIELEARLKEFDDFESLVDVEESSDIVFVMNGKKLHAHKSILKIKSEVFAAMFTHKMKENEKSIVDIEDVTYEIMRELLRFVYAGRVENLDAVAMELLVAADKYLIEGLKNLCERHLFQNMNDANVLEYLNFASSHNAPTLQERSMIYFKSNVKKVMQKSNIKLYELDKSIIDEVYSIVTDSLKD